MSAHTATIPDIIDTGRRVIRTVVQVGIPAFFALAGAVPVLLDVLAGVNLSPNARLLLVGVAGGITGAAGLLTRVMAVPAVNTLLERVRLGGQSVAAGPADTETRMIALSALSDASH